MTMKCGDQCKWLKKIICKIIQKVYKITGYESTKIIAYLRITRSGLS